MKTQLPTLFVPHGAPTFALRPGAAGAAMTEAAGQLPRPRAIVIISPHWDTELPTVGNAERLSTIHDFYGFPQELYELNYPATGCPEGAHEVAAAISAAGLPVREVASEGLDHGAWTVLCHLFPQHNIPCFELSINYSRPLGYHISLARELQFLREKGVLIMGSGNIVHNLQASVPNLSSGQENFGYEWAQEFDAWSAKLISDKNVEGLLDYERAPGGRYAVQV